jgi:hypothetical protein
MSFHEIKIMIKINLNFIYEFFQICLMIIDNYL